MLLTLWKIRVRKHAHILSQRLTFCVLLKCQILEVMALLSLSHCQNMQQTWHILSSNLLLLWMKSVFLQWLASHITSEKSKLVLRVLFNCNVNRVCDLFSITLQRWQEIVLLLLKMWQNVSCHWNIIFLEFNNKSS